MLKKIIKTALNMTGKDRLFPEIHFIALQRAETLIKIAFSNHHLTAHRPLNVMLHLAVNFVEPI